MKKRIKIYLIFGLFFTSLGGGWLHYRAHPHAQVEYGWVPFIVGLITMILVPILFYFRKTLNLAYLINGFSVILGTIAMTHFSLEMRAALGRHPDAVGQVLHRPRHLLP